LLLLRRFRSTAESQQTEAKVNLVILIPKKQGFGEVVVQVVAVQFGWFAILFKGEA